MNDPVRCADCNQKATEGEHFLQCDACKKIFCPDCFCFIDEGYKCKNCCDCNDELDELEDLSDDGYADGYDLTSKISSLWFGACFAFTFGAAGIVVGIVIGIILGRGTCG